MCKGTNPDFPKFPLVTGRSSAAAAATGTKEVLSLSPLEGCGKEGGGQGKEEVGLCAAWVWQAHHLLGHLIPTGHGMSVVSSLDPL